MKLFSSVLVLLAVLPCAAQAGTLVTSNDGGAGVLLEQVLTQRTRPLFAAVRSPRGTFGPLRALTPPTYFDDQQVALDDTGGAVAVWTQFDALGFPGRILVATREPGRRFGRPGALYRGRFVEPPLLALNRRGDAIVVWARERKPTLYSFRPAGGAFSAPAEIPDSEGADALALDGDGGAFLVWFARAEVKASYRPPGGSFGPGQAVDASTGHVATDRDGDMLLAWREGDTLRATERPAGSGSFEPPTVIAGGLRGADTIHALAVNAAGDAAVAYGLAPLRIVTGHGGLWSAPQDLAVGPRAQSFRMAMNRRGDTALSWATVDLAAHISYRPAEAGFGAPRRASPPRPFAPDWHFFDPGLAIDNAGRATLTWEESDGAHVSVYARDFDGRSTRPRQRVGRLSTYRREGPASACRPSWGRVIKSSSQSTLFVGTRGDEKGYHYGCLLARGAPVALFEEEGLFPPIALAGPLVGYASDSCDPDECLTFISVTDLRDESDGVNRGVDFPPSEVPALVLKPNGAVAWVSCSSLDPTYGTIDTCTAKSRTKKRVYALDRLSFRPRLLQVGRRIVPRSLALHGSRLSWRDARKRRSAHLH